MYTKKIYIINNKNSQIRFLVNGVVTQIYSKT